jgi:alkylation response protein AidB-like acyl-CoA dehydrogenase
VAKGSPTLSEVHLHEQSQIHGKAKIRIAGETLSLNQRADLLLAMTHAASSATQAVELAYSVAGTSGFRTGSPLERYFRDIQVLKHHTLAAETRYETVGQVYLGLPPDFPVLAF